MNLRSAKPVTCILTLCEIEQVIRPIRGSGGAQTLLSRITKTFDARTQTLEVSDADLLKANEYAYRCKSAGGFQSRLRTVVKAARRADWKARFRVEPLRVKFKN